MGAMEARREQRLAEQLAKRGTSEWQQAGDELQQQRAERARREAEQRAAANARRVADYWERRQLDVPPAKLDKLVEQFESALHEAAADSGIDEDSIAVEIADSVLLQLRPTRANVALALELLRCQFAMSTAEGLAHLRRIGGVR